MKNPSIIQLLEAKLLAVQEDIDEIWYTEKPLGDSNIRWLLGYRTAIIDIARSLGYRCTRTTFSDWCIQPFDN